MNDREAVIDLIHRHAQLTDDGDFAARAALYTEDAVFIGANRQPHQGREAIVDAFRSLTPPRRLGKHITANVVVELDDGDASAQTDYVFFRMTPEGVGSFAIGRYVDRFTKTTAGWRFTRREITAIDPADASSPEAP